jgi:hypothetical protein
MSDDSTRDTQPSPPPGVEAEIVQAAADDIDDTIATLRAQVSNLEAVAKLLRREATDARH